MTTKVEYLEAMDAITNGIMRHNESFIEGALLLQEKYHPSEHEQKEEIMRLCLQ